MTREERGKLVRRVWVDWALEQPGADDHPSWLLTWSEIDDGQREVDMRIGDAVAKAERESIAARMVALAEDFAGFPGMADLRGFADLLRQEEAEPSRPPTECPECGEPVRPATAACPACGTELPV